ncbi:MAG TPA: RNA 2',3'-cyclic phosphodiesterase [Candidatus Portnoybacteria bacterium]|nr:RNA 2',3'-cyclic phosphodiesterase [Candidatus Portnoybacteria bacterium]
MKTRIFVAINLPSEIKKKFLSFQQKWPDLPVRWTKEENLHITLIFIGYVGDEEIVETCQIAKGVTQKQTPFEINLKRIYLGPPQGTPRMIWVEGEKSQELAELKDNLEKSLLRSQNSGPKSKEVRAFSPHITLARIKQLKWRELKEKPKIDLEISASFLVSSIEIMQSTLKPEGPEYVILEKAELGG